MLELPSMDQQDNQEEESLKLDGPLKRNWPLLLAIVISFLIGPHVSNFLKAYRAVILDVQGEQMFVGWGESKPPSWEAYGEGKPSDIIVKELGSFSTSIEKAKAEDEVVMRLYQRYTSTYAGVVRAIEAPLRRGGAHVAIVTLDGGGEYRLPIWDEELAEMIAVGRRVEKHKGKWDPVVWSKADDSSIKLAPGTVSPSPSSGGVKP